MPEVRGLVINTSPSLALIAATGDLEILRKLYDRVLVPYEVVLEIQGGGASGFGVDVFEKTTWIERSEKPVDVPSFLASSLDIGEASVIQTAIEKGISRVAIDEIAGRRIARLSGLKLIGSLGILITAKKQGILGSMSHAIRNLEQKGIWLSKSLIDYALEESGERKL